MASKTIKSTRAKYYVIDAVIIKTIVCRIITDNKERSQQRYAFSPLFFFPRLRVVSVFRIRREHETPTNTE